MIPVRTYSSASEMLSNYERVRKQLRRDNPEYRAVVVALPPSPPPPPPLPPEPDPRLVEFEQLLDQRLTLGAIRRKVARKFDVRETDLMSARRDRQLCVIRQIAMALSKHITLRSLPEIGRAYGGRDHTTVLHAVRKFEAFFAALPAPREDEEWTLDDWIAKVFEQWQDPQWSAARNLYRYRKG
jgi:hypothetical protein